MEAIFRRRSVRQFTGDPVSREDIELILRAGMQAPSAGNQQPWHFIVIDDQELLKGIAAVHPYASMLPKADCGILILGDLSREVHAGYWVQDCAACAENMLLAVTERNLGGVWLGVYPVEDRVTNIRKLFGLAESLVPFAVVAIGHPASHPERADRYDASRVHWNGW